MPPVVTENKKPLFFTLASIAIVVGALYWAQDVLVPLALALLFSFLLAPLVSRAERMGLGRITSTLLVVLIVLSAAGSFGWVMENRFVEILNKAPEYRQSIATKLHQLSKSNQTVEQVREEIRQTVKEVSAPTSAPATRPATAPVAAVHPVAPASRATPADATAPTGATPPITPDSPLPVRLYPEQDPPLSVAMQYLTKILGPIGTGALVMVFVIFMLLNREDLRDRLIFLIGRDRMQVTTEALNDAATRVSRFLMAQSVINLSFGVLVAAGIWIIDRTLGGAQGGVETALLAGLVCGVLRFIPYIGTWIGAALPLAFAYAAFPGNSVFFATLTMFVVIEVFVSQAVEPHVLGSSTGISPIAVLVATAFWTWLWGPVGLLLSTPLTVLLVVMGKYVPHLEFLDVLLGDKPPLDPPTRIYQRLIAGDDDEAAEVALEYLKTMPLEEVYDTVLLPALATAQRDWHTGKLDEPHYDFLRQGFKDIVQALNDQQKIPDPSAPQPPRPDLQKDADVHVLCLPAQDEADEIAGKMLAHLLERRGYRVTGLGAASLASEMVDLIDGHKCHAVVVSALPPKAALHVRYLLKRLWAKYPDLKIVVGLWTDTRYSEKNHVRDLGELLPAVSLAQAQEQLD